MIFNSLDFFYLVVITFGLYYLPALRRVQFPVLIGASFVFYAWNFPALLLLLLFSIFVNALGSYGVAYSSSAGRQRSIAVASVVVNVLLLALFKYAGLIGTTFFKGQHQIVDYLVAIPLPVGISFFTFQGISLVVDTFRERDLMCRQGQVSKSFWLHLMNTSLFISLFPQLVAGPIVKAKYFFPQIRYKFLKDIEWEEVFRMVVVGYFLKMVVADNLKDFTFELTWPYFERLSSVHLLVLLFAYSIQIFADFAGYSLIAIGLSLLFGYRIPQNFNFPYVATSFADFWRRWHISLSSFLKEYLYIPLGGNRRGRFRTYLNLLIVMALGGLWHGAAWSYMLWGTAHGLFLALERFLKDYAGVVGGGTNRRYVGVIKALGVFVVVSAAWLLFKLPDFNHVIAYFKSVAANGAVYTDYVTIYTILVYCLPVAIYHIGSLTGWGQQGVVARYLKPAVLAFLLVLIFLNSGSPQDFIYFQF